MNQNFVQLILLSLSAMLITACSGEQLDKSADSSDKAMQRTLTREWQRVKRYDCKNQLTSDQWETISSPRQLVSLYPKEAKNFYMLRLRNPGLNRAIGVSDFNFWIDAEQGFLSMWVKSGINEILYDYQYCDSRALGPDGKPTGNCAHEPYSLESGSIFINVTYKQIQKPEVAEFHPAPEQCKPPL